MLGLSTGKIKSNLTGKDIPSPVLQKKILIEQYGWSDNIHVNGWRYFTKDGVTLSDLRDDLESADVDEG